MKTLRKTIGSQTYFIISEFDPAYHDTARELEFNQVEDGFAKVFLADPSTCNLQRASERRGLTERIEKIKQFG